MVYQSMFLSNILVTKSANTDEEVLKIVGYDVMFETLMLLEVLFPLSSVRTKWKIASELRCFSTFESLVLCKTTFETVRSEALFTDVRSYKKNSCNNILKK